MPQQPKVQWFFSLIFNEGKVTLYGHRDRPPVSGALTTFRSESVVLQAHLKRHLSCIFICLWALPLAGLLSDPPHFRYAFSRVLPGIAETGKVREAVTDFNNRLMDVYASQGVKRAADTIPATTGMRHRLFKDAGFLEMGGRVLVYDLASLEIRGVEMGGPLTATAVAREEWNYQYKNDRDWKSVADVRGTGSLFRYHLVRKGGKWLVLKYEPVRVGGKGA